MRWNLPHKKKNKKLLTLDFQFAILWDMFKKIAHWFHSLETAPKFEANTFNHWQVFVSSETKGGIKNRKLSQGTEYHYFHLLALNISNGIKSAVYPNNSLSFLLKMAPFEYRSHTHISIGQIKFWYWLLVVFSYLFPLFLSMLFFQFSAPEFRSEENFQS